MLSLLMEGNITLISYLLCNALLTLILSIKIVFIPLRRWGKKERKVKLNNTLKVK